MNWYSKTQEFILLDALDVLGIYLTGSAISPLSKKFIGMLCQIPSDISVIHMLTYLTPLEIDEPLCTGKLTQK